MYCYNCMNKLPDDNNFCQRCGRASVPERAPHHLTPGTVLDDRYMIGNALGEDGYSITYIGRDLNLGLIVTVREYYPMGHVTRDSSIANTVRVYADEEEQAYFRAGCDRFVEEARRLQEEGTDIRDIFRENRTVYVAAAMKRQQRTPNRPANAPRHSDDRYGDNFDGSEENTEQDSVDIRSHSDGKKPPQKKKKLSGGAIAAIIIGSVVVVALIVTMIVLMLNGKKGNTDPTATTVATTAAATTSAQSSKQDDTVSMPDVSGMKLSDAQGELERLGLRVEISREYNSDVAKDYVIRQSAETGQTLRKGDTVMLYVSDGAAEEPTTEAPHDPPEFDSASASSTRPDDAGGSYDVYNLTVNDTTCWSAEGGDNGEWVYFGANSEQWVNGVMLINGNARDNDSFQKNSRVTALRFEFSDGTSVEKPVDDSTNLQYIAFGREVSTSSIKMTVIGHHDGSENKNICITYARPYL